LVSGTDLIIQKESSSTKPHEEHPKGSKEQEKGKS
jgi:hypothetical protein